VKQFEKTIEASVPVPELSIAKTVFTAFDFETTGLDPANDAITEIGAVKFTFEKVIAEYATLVDPGRPIPEIVTKITGISDCMVRGKPCARVALRGLLDFIGDTVLVAHHAPFDASFLRANLLSLGMPMPTNLILDTRIMAKRILGKLPGYRLDRICSCLGVIVPCFHRAVADASACRDVFCAMVRSVPCLENGKLSQIAETAIVLSEYNVQEPV